MPRAILLSSVFTSDQEINATPPMLRNTAKHLDKVSRSPKVEGNAAAKSKVKRLEVELNTVTKALSLGTNANWYK